MAPLLRPWRSSATSARPPSYSIGHRHHRTLAAGALIPNADTPQTPAPASATTEIAEDETEKGAPKRKQIREAEEVKEDKGERSTLHRRDE